MDDNKKDIGVYRRLKPYTFSFIVKLLVYLLFLLIIDAMCIAFLIFSFITDHDYAAVGFAVAVLVLVSFLMIRSAKKNLRYQNSLAKKRKRMRNALSYNQFAELETEINGTERFCGTVYFLDKFVYVPKTRLLIEYENIKTVTTVTHTTDGLTDGARVIIVDENGMSYEFWIFKWKQFLENQELFREKISKGGTPSFIASVEKANV